MSFTETREPFGEYTKITVAHKESGNEIAIIPEMGARLNHFQVNLHGESVDIIDGYSDGETFADGAYSKSSLLAPYPNRIADGQYMFRGKEYQLDINKDGENNAIHGFVSNKDFHLKSSGIVEDYYELVFQYVSEGAKGYPFSFKMTVIYRFGGVWLEVDTKLTNLGKTNIPAGFGWHPYFKIGDNVSELRLRLPEVEKISVDKHLIPTGKKEIYTDFANLAGIGNTEFDTGFQLIGKQGEVELYNELHGLYVTLSMMGKDNPYQYVQLYIPPSRDSIAVGPMTCAANALNNGLGLRILAPEESLHARFTILVS
jgi:aldose 1-epimerase